MSEAEPAVIVERRGAIAIVSLNQPKKRNALSRALTRALSDTFAALQDEPELRALVVTGGEHFCVGGDLGDLGMSGPTMRNAMLVGQRMIRQIAGGRLPVVAAVQGSAFGAGFALAMACDFVVADENSTFGAAFGRIGLTPDYGLMWSLPQRVGMSLAREILYFCEPVKGRQAKEIGMVDRLVPVGEVLSAAIAMAEKLALLPPATVATTKAVLSRHPLNLDTMLAWEADTQALLVGTADFAEGVKAFGERRAARFKGD